MKVFSITLAALVAAAINMVSLDAATVCKSSDPQLAANKKAAQALLDDVFNKKDISAVDKYIGSVYLQHNPAVPDGPQSLKDFASIFTSETKVEFGATVAMGDLVWLNTRYTGIPGMNTSVGVDVMRFENGKIVEHWDVLQTEVPVAQTASGRPMFPIDNAGARAGAGAASAAQVPATKKVRGACGGGEDDAAAAAAASDDDDCASMEAQQANNIKSMRALLDDVFNKKDISAVDKYVGSVYLQHNPLVPDGPDALRSFAAQFTSETKVEFGASAAVGDLVWFNTRYTAVPGEADSVAVDVMRFENGKIVEHWDFLQADVAASKTASGRPMFPIQG
jgi:predicted SnoaL-like aldol condensation-catalyzing enzyme